MSPPRGDQAARSGPPSGFLRVVLVLSITLNVVAGIIIGALWDPMGIRDNDSSAWQVPTVVEPAQPARPSYQYAPNSNAPTDGSQQCPDAGSIIAGRGDSDTEVVVLEGSVAEPVLLLGPNRRVVIDQDAVVTGPVTMCGDGGTLLIAGSMQGDVVMRGNGVKIVVQDGGKEKLPPAYSTSNGLVLTCTTVGTNSSLPHCDNYRPRRDAKPNG